jgi:phosphatidylserine decarboxylase
MAAAQAGRFTVNGIAKQARTGRVKRIVPIAKEGWFFVAAPLVASGVAFWTGLPLVAALFLAGAVGLAVFFRDPKRHTAGSPASILCPADGRVVGVAEVEEPDYLGSRSRRISIFMSLLNVHMNYAPITGQVEFLRYRKGRFLRANLDEASFKNENNSIGIKGEKHRVMVRQIAGTIARRIVCRVKVNDRVEAGQKIGLIKFGSRVDVFVPADWEILVGEGDRVVGGISEIARVR